MKVTCIGPLIPAINQANDQSPGKKDGCHPPSNGARLSLTLFECPLSICGFVLAAAIWLFNSPLRTAVIRVSMTFGRLVERRHRNGGLALLKLYSPRRMPKAYISLPAGRHHA
jgi:hypothetical protein